MFDDVLIESAGRDKKKGGWKTVLISGFLHMVIIGAVVAAGYYVKKNPEIIIKPIQAFVVSAPPPPPPPPPAASHASSTPQVQHVEQTPQTFHQPTKTPREVPQTENVPTDTTGGQEGGVVGGQVGATGDKPMRVGGDVMPPRAVKRVEPVYPDVGRKAKIQGIVILETIIDRDGNVTDVRVLKGLPLGLDQSAIDAVKRWKFEPGRLNGQPVPVIFTLTVNFMLH